MTTTAPSTAMQIGGTSGTGSGTLSMNLGGVNVNYDLGPSVSTLAAQSAAFLNNSWNNDAAFLGGAIVGANNLVAGLTAPLIQSAQTQMTFDNTQLPSMYQNLMNQNFNIGQGAIAAESQVAQASVAASQSAAQSAGGCFITTAVCDSLGLPDDCETLRTLRRFRDEYLARSETGRAHIQEYYATAPKLCEKILARKDAKYYCASLYARFILPALLAIEWKLNENAFSIYRRMVIAVRKENP